MFRKEATGGQQRGKVSQMHLIHQAIGTNSVVVAAGCFWFYSVTRTIPAPYLDEEFHARQALAYWAGHWDVWDPKITTPPGLYVVSYLWLWLLHIGRVSASLLTQLRLLNLFEGVVATYFISRQLLHDIVTSKGSSGKADATSGWPPSVLSLDIEHMTLNICLFPLLFFFSSLYYTDLTSVVFVLISYVNFKARNTTRVVLGSLIALCMRQTNIFWTAVYLGGLEVVRILTKDDGGLCTSTGSSLHTVVSEARQHGRLYDPLVSEADFQDYVKTCISLMVACVSRVGLIKRPLLPYVFLVGAFGSFVLWNGGVVLGDKEHHVASLHLAQMLYIWPCIMFFSFPVLIPHILCSIILRVYRQGFWVGWWDRLLPRIIRAIPHLAVMLAIVRFNTLVHPFTLADNRHYTFYVVRYLLRYPTIKYGVVSIYFICAWAAISALGGLPQNHERSKDRNEEQRRRVQGETPRSLGNRVSFVLVWLLTTSLSLVTAPLVEPRYFIIPWLMWRLHVPTWRFPQPNGPMGSEATEHGGNEITRLEMLLQHRQDYCLWLETIWFLLINGATGYIFLNWGFEWSQEPGITQRFMW